MAHTFRFAPLVVLVALGAVVGCSAPTKMTRLGDGSYRLVCSKGMRDCVTRADKLCDKRGYTITEGKSQVHLLGGDGSNYQQAAYRGELVVYCGEFAAANDNGQTIIEFPRRKDDAVAPVATAPAASCMPGSTQACVGRAACAGGQVCLPDGSGFGPCDCGDTPPPAAAPAPASPAPTPAPQPAPAPVPGAAPSAEPLAQ